MASHAFGLYRRTVVVNSVALIGTLVEDPEFSWNHRGGDVCLLRLAVPRWDRRPP